MVDSLDKSFTNEGVLEASENIDEVLEITDKFYKKVSDSMNKAGFADGVADGQASIFQQSFDKGYEDGFRNGFLMGKMKNRPQLDESGSIDQNARADRGNCQICVDPKLLEKEEREIQERHGKIYQEMHEKLRISKDKEKKN